MIHAMIGFLLFCACVGVVVRFWRIALGVLGVALAACVLLAMINYTVTDTRARMDAAARAAAAGSLR